MYMTNPVTAEGFQWHLWRGGCHVNDQYLVITLKQPCLYRLFVFMDDGLLDSPAVVLKSATTGVLSLISVSGLGIAYWRQLNWTGLPSLPRPHLSGCEHVWVCLKGKRRDEERERWWLQREEAKKKKKRKQKQTKKKPGLKPVVQEKKMYRFM